MIFVALVHKLMRSGYELEVVHVVELLMCVSGRDGGVTRCGHTSLETLSPNSQPAPRGLTAQVSTSSGSDQTKSQKAPS